MSRLGDAQVAGSAAVIPVLTEAGPGIPYFASASGGGGGGGGPILTVSTINVNGNGGINCRMTDDVSAEIDFDHDSGPIATSALLYDDTNGVSSLVVYTKQGTYGPGTLTVADMRVSTINGAAPGSGFASTFNAPVANGASTLLMSLPPGTWAYNGQMLYGGSLTYTAGFLTSLNNLSSSTYYASIMPFLADNSVPPDTNPNGLISISNGGNPLSTVNVYAVNPSTLSGDANWIGAITKL